MIVADCSVSLYRFDAAIVTIYLKNSRIGEKNMLKQVSSLILIISLIFVSACTKTTQENAAAPNASEQPAANTQPKQEVIEYTIYNDNFRTLKLAPEATDVVTPYVEQKFGLKVKQFLPLSDLSFKEKFNAWVATDTIPDVLVLGKESADYAASTGKFADLTDYIEEMPNYNKWFPSQFWPRFMNDGKKYQLAVVSVSGNEPKLKDDPYFSGVANWAPWVREDLLAKAGYKFKKLADIKKEKTDLGIKATEADFALDPPIKTPDDYFNLLKKIKELNLKVGDKSVIPFSSSNWSQFHIGTMFDFGHWSLGADGQVDGWLGSKEAKDYYKFLNKMYNENIIDKDFVIQKDDQLQSKIASGLVASGMYVPDIKAARQSLTAMNPDAQIRFIPWPKQAANKGVFDIYEGGFWRVLIKKDFKDVKRMVQFLDWSLSDEGMDILTWGPESAGLWEMKDGKKVFKDKAVEDDVLNGTLGKKGSDYYGLYTVNNQEPAFYSKAAAAGLSWGTKYNPQSFVRSYSPKQDVYILNQAIASVAGVNTDGTASYGDGTDLTSGVNSYFWSKFQNLDVAKVLVPKTPQEFDSVWDSYINAYKKEVKYDQARDAMMKWFKDNAGK